ncbi:hypothetical protein [Streptomyces sp. NPDC048584]|uniref:hypothetical protein n=1 Tax=Streptomyces sp. NPDC048584 TaxID=3365573 RepID=UPI00371D8A10
MIGPPAEVISRAAAVRPPYGPAPGRFAVDAEPAPPRATALTTTGPSALAGPAGCRGTLFSATAFTEPTVGAIRVALGGALLVDFAVRGLEAGGGDELPPGASRLPC